MRTDEKKGAESVRTSIAAHGLSVCAIVAHQAMSE